MNKKLINEAIKLLEKVTRKKVVLKENDDISKQKNFAVKTDGSNSKEITVDVLDKISFKGKQPLNSDFIFWWCNRNGYLDVVGYEAEDGSYTTYYDVGKEEILESQFGLSQEQALKVLDKAAEHYNLKADWY